MSSEDSLSDAIRAATGKITDRLIAIRRQIHAHPEMAFQEHQTSALVRSVFSEIGVPFEDGMAETGVIGVIDGTSNQGSGNGRSVGVRGDMDCLPISETTGAPYASTRPGFMHACGHDAHTAIALGVAMVLNELKSRFSGRVAVVLQPAEEGQGGAARMIEDGALARVPMDRMIGYHVWPALPAGTIGFHPDVSFASADGFDIVLKGKSGHAAHPHLAIDCISAAAYFITQLQTLVSREIAPVSPAVVSVGRIEGGTARNVLPDQVRISGTMRSQSPEARLQLQEAVERLLGGIRTGMRVDYDYVLSKGAPVLRNDQPTLATYVEAARQMVGPDKVVMLPHGSMGAEDFAYFLEKVPGAHIRIGSRVDGLDTMLHRSNFDIDERALPTAVEVVSRAALMLLEKEA